MDSSKLISAHGGYRNLLSFKVAQLAYDLTSIFCERWIDRYSRTRDQMVQAARSGVQNIAEGSQASGTSRKTELKLTNVARASLEELRLDYEDFLRQKGLALWPKGDLRRQALVDGRPKDLEGIFAWKDAVLGGLGGPSGRKSGQETESTASTTSTESTEPEVLANGAHALICVACALLDRQLRAQEEAFMREGGFTERLYRARKEYLS